MCLQKKRHLHAVPFNVIRYEQQMRRLVAFFKNFFQSLQDIQEPNFVSSSGGSIHCIKNVHQHSGSSVALQTNKAMAINQRHGGDGNAMLKDDELKLGTMETISITIKL